jgi:hypothetical protein
VCQQKSLNCKQIEPGTRKAKPLNDSGMTIESQLNRKERKEDARRYGCAVAYCSNEF